MDKYLTKQNVESQIRFQEKALAADNPESNCAAGHRGYIKAMGLVLEWMKKDEYNEQDNTNMGSG